MTAAPAAPAVLVTRPGGSRDPLVARLAGSGVRVHAVPTVAIGDVTPGGDLDVVAGDLSGYDWVVVTSTTAVAALVAALGRAGRRPAPVQAPGRAGVAVGGAVSAPAGTVSATGGPRFAAVGPATARALREAGIPVTVAAADATGAGLGDALRSAGDLVGRRLLLPRASAAGPELPALLRAAGAEVREVVAYETVEGPAASLPALAAAVADPLLGAVVVASGSAVRGLLAIAAIADAAAADPAAAEPSPLETVLRALPFVSIGPTTSEEVRRLGLDLAAEAAAPTVDALADAVLGVLGRRGAPGPRAGERRDATRPRPRSGDGPSIDAHPTEVHR
jgi:uroporphyrinogen-III synthase